MHKTLHFLAIGLALEANVVHAITIGHPRTDVRNIVPRSERGSWNAGALTRHLVRRSNEADPLLHTDQGASTRRGQSTHPEESSLQTPPSRLHERPSVYASPQTRPSPGSRHGASRIPRADSVTEGAGAGPRRPGTSTPPHRVPAPPDDSARALPDGAGPGARPPSPPGRAPAPNPHEPAVARTRSQRARLREQLAAAGGPHAHTFFRHVPGGPLYRLQRHPRGFRAWRERHPSEWSRVWQDIPRTVGRVVTGRQLAHVRSHHVPTTLPRMEK